MSKPSLDLWRPELRRAMMKVRPEYFAWPIERQERYGVAMPEADRAHLDAALLAELFGYRFAGMEEAAAAADHLSIAERNVWNQAVLPLEGIGENCFYLNEYFAEGETILDFDTVQDFDEDDYRFQEEARKKDDPGYTGKPYRGSLYLNWARLSVDGRFTYANLSMAAGYIYAKLENAAHELLEECIPHRYVPGRNHGKVEGGQWQWDLRVEANGQEGVLEELQRRVWRYDQARYDALLTACHSAGRGGVYLLDESEPPEANLHVVFTDRKALEAVRFHSFLRDCRAIERSAEELHGAVDEERTALVRLVDEQHADVLRNYDPKVARFSRRRKVMVNKDAFDSLK